MQTQKFIEKYGDVELRALSWKQPFASLMLHGKIETRVWDSKYRGLVLICASKAIYTANEIEEISGDKLLNRMADWQTFKNLNGYLLPTAKAIAIGRLVDSRPMVKMDEDNCFVKFKNPWLFPLTKTSFGHPVTTYKEKRLWCHVYEDVQAIEHIDWKGTQGWSTVTDEVKQQIILK